MSRIVKLKEKEVDILFQAIFNEILALEKAIEYAISEDYKANLSSRLSIMEAVSKKVMHARRIPDEGVIVKD